MRTCNLQVCQTRISAGNWIWCTYCWIWDENLANVLFLVDSAVLAFPACFLLPTGLPPPSRGAFGGEWLRPSLCNKQLLVVAAATFTWSSLVCCRLGGGGGGSTKFNRQRLEVKLKILPEMSIDDAKYVWPNYAYCLELMTGANLVMARLMILFWVSVCLWVVSKSIPQLIPSSMEHNNQTNKPPWQMITDGKVINDSSC